jgi:hypothetical protein
MTQVIANPLRDHLPCQSGIGKTRWNYEGIDN